MTTAKAPGADDVIEYMDSFAADWPKGVSRAMFYFLYKEILVNRINLLEVDSSANRGAIEHNERVVNDLNVKLMDQIAKKKS